MRILLVYPAPPRDRWPLGLFRSRWVPTGLACIAAVLRRAGHVVAVHLREQTLERHNFDWAAADAQLRQEMVEFRPDMVGLSVVTPGVADAAAIAAMAKESVGPQTLVVAGGVHPTALPDSFLQVCPAADAVVVGEGEWTMAELADQGVSASVRGLVFRRDGQLVRTPPRPLEHDLDRLGPPAYELFDMAWFTRPSRWLIRWLPLSATNLRTGRGCTNRCRFCAGHLVGGVGVRAHSIDYVVDQVLYAADKLGVAAVHFEDDTLGADPARLVELCGALRRKGLHKRIRWDGCLRADQAEAGLLAEMKSAGCIQVEYGFESGSDESLRALGKGATVDVNRRAVELTHKAGLRIFADIMLGLPGETPRGVRQTIRFIEWARPEVLGAGRLCPLPGTPLYDGLPPEVRARVDWGGDTYPERPASPVNLTAMEGPAFDEIFRRFQKYVSGPHLAAALLRDTPAGQDQELRRSLRRKLRRFIVRHPLRALRLLG
jgi:radical SAM superfamily enzyme YgiQ (UPF0313 family)